MRYVDQSRTLQVKCKESGSVAVEFALVVFLLLIIVAGIVEFGRTFWYYDALSKSTRDAARFLSNVPVDNVGDLAKSAAGPSECNSDAGYTITANRIVYCAALKAKVPDFDILNNVDVRCDASACVNGVRPNYITVSIENYPVRIGGWIPFIFSTGEVTNWTLTLSPETTMRYMR